jgi:putative transposase
MWINYLQNHNNQISLEGKDRALNNVWIERFWKSLKYDYIFLKSCDDSFELYEGVQNHN